MNQAQEVSWAQLIKEKIEGTPKSKKKKGTREDLTEMERQVLEVEETFYRMNRVPATDAEIASLLEVSAPAVRATVWSLVDRGFLWRKKGKARWTVVM